MNSLMSRENIFTRELFQERAVYLLIFLFPVAAMLIRGWSSYIFTLFIVLALIFYGKREQEISREETTLLWLAVLAFISFQISSMDNGWNGQSTKALGMDLRVLLFVPLYYLVRPLKNASWWLLWGVFFGALILGIQSLYELFYLGAWHVKGAYFHLNFGGFSVLYAFLLIVSFNMLCENRRWRKILMVVAIAAALLGLAGSGARGSYIVVPALIVMIVLLKYRNRVGASILVLSVISALLIYQFSPIVKTRVNDAVADVQSYIAADSFTELRETSQVSRLEMWRTAWMIFKDNPVWGVGQKNYKEQAKKYVDRGLVHPAAAHHGHPHNVYLDFLAATGIMGFLLMMALHFYPAVVFLKTYPKSRDTALLGLVFIATYAVLGLTEANTLTKGNYLSTFLVFLAIFFSWHIREVNRADCLDLKQGLLKHNGVTGIFWCIQFRDDKI